MKFSKKIILTTAFTTFASYLHPPFSTTGDVNNIVKGRQKPAYQNLIYRPTELKFTTGEIYVTHKNFETIKQGYTIGCFYWPKNEIRLNYFVTNEKNDLIERFCAVNRNRLITVRRHELEHARKICLTKCTYCPMSWARAQVVAMDEVMARASEIIEALDYQFKNGAPCPVSAPFICNARREILGHDTERAITWPVDFNNRETADIVLKYAMQSFVRDSKFYKENIIAALKTNRATQPVQQHYSTQSNGLFYPMLGLWAPLFEYETAAGGANIWNSASPDTKTNIIKKIDSLIYKFTGENAKKFKNIKTR